MKNKTRFLRAWVLFTLGVFAASFIALVLIRWFLVYIDYFDKDNKIFILLAVNKFIYWFLILIPIVIWFIRRSNRLEVSQGWNVIGEWEKQRMQPFEPGWHYPFWYFGYFDDVSEVPMNKQTLSILSGRREGYEQSIIDEYVYGSASDMDPGTGSALCLLYKADIQCVDSLTANYCVKGDPYEYIADRVEWCVGLYVHARSSEEIIDNFSKETLDSVIPDYIKEDVLLSTGFELLSFFPGDVSFNEETAASRAKEEQLKRKKVENSLELENKVQLEVGNKLILLAELDNRTVIENIAKKDDQIRVNTIKSLKDGADVDGEKALEFIIKEKTLETVKESAQKGNITYIDDSKGGALNQSAALGFAINANNQNK